MTARRYTPLFVLCFLVLATVAARSDAAVIAYTDRPTWLTAVGPLSGTEDFNSFVSDTTFQSVSVALNNMTVTGTTGSNGAATQKIDAPPLEFSGFYDLDGTAQLLGDVTGSSEFVRFDFIIPVTAWGADMSGVANVPRDTKIHVYDASDTLLGSVFMSTPDNSSRQFYGFGLTSGEADHIILTDNTDGNDVFGLDDIGFVTIPEPTSIALAAISLLGMLLKRRKRGINHGGPGFAMH